MAPVYGSLIQTAVTNICDAITPGEILLSLRWGWARRLGSVRFDPSADLRSATMSDRGVFLAAFLTLVLVVACIFGLPEFFVSELIASTIFVVIAVMVYFGEDKFPYMLGMIAPILWFIYALLTGGFISDLGAMFRFLSGKPLAPLETPLHGFAILSGVALVIACARAWRKQITEKFFGKTFVSALIVGLIWIVVLAVWQNHAMSAGARPH
jgi:hypothetical protein